MENTTLNRLHHTSGATSQFEFALLEQITDNFSKDRVIGHGAYGVVYKGVMDNGETIAVKKLSYMPPDHVSGKQFHNECTNLMRVQHQNIVRLVGYCNETHHKSIELTGELVFCKENKRALCFEYLQGGSLDKHVSDEPCRLDWDTCYKIIKGVCEGLNHLHNGYKDPIFHLDLKPGNILLDNDMIPKIGDYGLSRLFSTTKTCSTTTPLGTMGYTPPEFASKQEISSKYDVFSLGVVIIHMIAGRKHYYDHVDTPSKIIELVCENWEKRLHTMMWSHASQEIKTCIEIALRCVKSDRQERPTISNIVDDLNRIDIAKNLPLTWKGDIAPKPKMVGVFQRIPVVIPATDIPTSAQRESRNVPPTKGITNIAKRERNKGAKQLDALMKELSVPLRTYTENFPRRRDLHPYERSLIELTFGEGYYEKVLGRVDALRKKINSVGKQHASVCAKSLTKREAEERLCEGRKELEEVFQHGQHAVEDLINVAKALRSMPVVDPHIPTLCLVGSPNVGKSSLVRILSTGKPEVCSYPFTTRGILMGHIVSNHERFQVTDTPGLLTRHDDDRNNIEKLTLAVLSYLPIAVLYVHDLSEDCGTKVADQYITYKHIKERFGDRLWINVISKCDLLDKAVPSSFDYDDDEVRRYRMFGPEDAIRVSVQSQVGTEELKERVHHLLTSQMARIKDGKNEDEPQGTDSTVRRLT